MLIFQLPTWVTRAPTTTLRSVLAALHPDLLCLPINGRDETRAAMGFAGNMTAEEAVELAARCGRYSGTADAR